MNNLKETAADPDGLARSICRGSSAAASAMAAEIKAAGLLKKVFDRNSRYRNGLSNKKDCVARVFLPYGR